MDPNIQRANRGPLNRLVVGPKTVWAATQFPTTENLALSAPTQVEVSPDNVGYSWGQTVRLKLQQQLPELHTILAHVTIGPITASGATYVRIVDEFAFFLWKLSKIRDPNFGDIYEVIPQRFQTMFRKMCPAQQQQLALQLGIGLPDATRATLASTGFTFTMELGTWFKDRLENTLRLQAIDVPLNVELTLANLAELVQTDGTNPTATINVQFTLDGRIPTEAERNTTGAVINSPDGQLMQVKGYQLQEVARIPAGTTGVQRYNVDFMKGMVTEYNLFFLKYSEAHGSTGSPLTPDYSNFDPLAKPSRIRFLTGNEDIIRTIDTRQLTQQERRKNYPNSYYEQDIVKVPLCEFPEMADTVNSGNVDHSYVGKPQVEFTFDTATPYDISFQLGYYIDQFIQHAQGTVRAVN